MLFNPSKTTDFVPEVNLAGQLLENVEEIRLLSITLRSDLKWKTNTENITKKAYKRLWTIKRLEAHGASHDDMLEVYKKQIRPILEFSVPVWHPGITKGESKDIERVQKCVTKIILQDRYKTYKQVLSDTNLQYLSERRNKICKKFALKAEKHNKFKKWFKVNKKTKKYPVYSFNVLSSYFKN